MMYARFPVARANQALSSSLAEWRAEVQAGRVWIYDCWLSGCRKGPDMNERERTDQLKLQHLAQNLGKRACDWRSSCHFHFTSLTRARTRKERVPFWKLSTNEFVA